MSCLPSYEETSHSQIERISKCPYCLGKHSSFFAKENGWRYVICRACGLIRLEERIKEQYISTIYNCDYHRKKNIGYELKVAKKRLGLLRLESHRPIRIHEDGAGIGAFAFTALKQGHVISASDLGQDSVDQARELFDITIEKKSIEELEVPKGSLDAFACFNLLSHLYEPWNYIDRVASLLRPGGIFIFRTGNRKGIFKHYGELSAPEHVYHYHSGITKKLCQANGLKLIREIPAFDSDVPLSIIHSRLISGLPNRIKKPARLAGLLTHRIWNFCKLPKEDYFYLFKK